MMATTRTSRSTSAVADAEAGGASEIQHLLGALWTRNVDEGDGQTLTIIENRVQTTHLLRQAILGNDESRRMRDAFRDLDGFQTILSILSDASKLLKEPDLTHEEKLRLLDLVHGILGLLTAALQDHWGNRKYFRKHVQHGGWLQVHTLLQDLVQGYSRHHQDGADLCAKIIGFLLACALQDDTLSELFLTLGRYVQQQEQAPNTSLVVETLISEALGSQRFLHNPEAIPSILGIWSLSRQTLHQGGSFMTFCPTVVRVIAESSTHNLAALHAAGLLPATLPMLLDSTLRQLHSNELQCLVKSLLALGINNLDDAHLLYRNATSSPLLSETVRHALKAPCEPAYVHFDLSLHGYASIELPDLGRAFPPASSSPGYTLSMWLQVIKFDPQSHTTLFGAFDSSQTCFVLLYLEKDSHHLILQTSVSSSAPSVRFKSFAFQTLRWYHLAIVHKRPRTTASSRASLFVDGEFVEQVKIQYPAAPPRLDAPTVGVGTGLLPQTRKFKPVQAFLGTPQDLATHPGSGTVCTQWRLASAYLYDDALSDDLIAVHKELGPRYYGNYQDCLGSFQTYEASASLNLRNETLHPGKEEKTEIVAAIRSKASELLPESSILLHLSAMTVIEGDGQAAWEDHRTLSSLSRPALKNLHHATRGGRTIIAINGATPSINNALLQSSGSAVLTGSPRVVIPQSLDDAAWRIGGCVPVILALLESAHSKVDILNALEISLNTVKNSWRNSEAMERENGFGVMANLLSTKLNREPPASRVRVELTDSMEDEGDLAWNVLILILNFVGYQPLQPQDSVINNPLAYRILLVDLDIWRSCSYKVQKLYYEQFATFGVGSKFHLFNMKRLIRMRLVKKWLDALKSDAFYPETFQYFGNALRSLLGSSLSADALRSLALFVTYSGHAPRNQTTYTHRTTKSIRKAPHVIARRLTAPSYISFGETDLLDRAMMSRREVGVKILELFAEILCQEDPTNIKKFARAVTNKWLLHLLAEDDPTVVVLASKILARLMIISGTGYVDKFADRTGGFVIMRYRLRRWWSESSLWMVCFAILFGKDVALVDLSRPFDLYNLLASFPPSEVKIVYPAVLPVVTAMLQTGLKSIVRSGGVTTQPREGINGSRTVTGDSVESKAVDMRNRSKSLQAGLQSSSSSSDLDAYTDVRDHTRIRTEGKHSVQPAKLIQTITRFLADLHSNCQNFRDFSLAAPYVQELLFLLFPIVVSADSVSAETELNSRDSSLTFGGNDVMIQPIAQARSNGAPIIRTVSIEESAGSSPPRTQPLKRGSSYILISSEESPYKPSSAKLLTVLSPSKNLDAPSNNASTLIEEVLEILMAVFFDQLFSRKEFAGLGLYMKVPPGFQEHQAYFESFVLRNTLSSLRNAIRLNQKLLWEPRVLANLSKFATHLGEAVYEGWFIDGAETTLDFLGETLEYLQRPDVQQLKGVRLCSEIIASIRWVISRIVLLRMSEPDGSPNEAYTAALLTKITYWQTVIFASGASQAEFLRLFAYLLYTKLISSREGVREVAANLWRVLMIQQQDDDSHILFRMIQAENQRLCQGFQKILELDNANFLAWVDDRREELDAIFFGKLNAAWEDFVAVENRKTEASAKDRVLKRKERLKTWVNDDMHRDDIVRRHEISSEVWRSNIFAAEHAKRQRSIQDQHDGATFNVACWSKMNRQLHRPCGILDVGHDRKWQLDQTEGRNRMRLRTIPDDEAHLRNYQAKGSSTRTSKRASLAVDVRDKMLEKIDQPELAPPVLNSEQKGDENIPDSKAAPKEQLDGQAADVEDDFEMVEEPQEGTDFAEDKNRKVMRSLQRGDRVEHVHNIARIIGLEAFEGLLLLGKDALYLLDDFFLRSDGEIVDVWHAPPEERDSYLQMISGRETGIPIAKPTVVSHETRNWRWEDVLSISKRRFLFREVAIEIFFVDGQSFLLTLPTPQLRDDVHQKLLPKTQQFAGRLSSSSPSDSWRIESLKTPEESPQTFGSRFTSVFNNSLTNPATKKWMNGEMSNFQYLMLVNTMAGRTFNDLTQYPVFPWVLADYTSEELDLTDPRTFRDLSKPMGCQTPEREAEFKERYVSFAEMGDHNAPPFHYGTHYSSAMIVTSFLIRLQPFVQSYLLLQGGSFDHPDRLFYSIEKAWISASRDNMTDVRELIPEFYYLPELFVNSNGYDFGSRQGNAGKIDNVALPPWAKGDPKIFIARHREALESEYVSKHLHRWIELVFGHKQRGEAALEATNVFHHLSYRGAKNLDEIKDPIERLATIGIIHNFGQTPHQVFQRPHPARADSRQGTKRLDTLAETLTRLPFPLLESPDRVSSLLYSYKNDRLLCSGPFRLNVPPLFNMYMEWGFIDGSVRFYINESTKLVGIFEHMHQGQITTALFVDARTLVTAGDDCTVAVWEVTAGKTVDLTPKGCLFGHRASITTISSSRSFSTLLSADSRGRVILWDLNRLELVRVLAERKPVELMMTQCAKVNDITGTIMLCRGPDVALFTLNGEPLLEQHVCVEGDETITSCAFYEGAGAEYIERSLIFTGHKRGVVNVWQLGIRDGKFVLDHVKRMIHTETSGFHASAAITCILPMPQLVYTGDDDGRVYEWDCIPRTD